MGVHLERHRRVGVPQPGGHGTNVGPEPDRGGGTPMAEVVQAPFACRCPTPGRACRHHHGDGVGAGRPLSHRQQPRTQPAVHWPARLTAAKCPSRPTVRSCRVLVGRRSRTGGPDRSGPGVAPIWPTDQQLVADDVLPPQRRQLGPPRPGHGRDTERQSGGLVGRSHDHGRHRLVGHPRAHLGRALNGRARAAGLRSIQSHLTAWARAERSTCSRSRIPAWPAPSFRRPSIHRSTSSTRRAPTFNLPSGPEATRRARLSWLLVSGAHRSTLSSCHSRSSSATVCVPSRERMSGVERGRHLRRRPPAASDGSADLAGLAAVPTAGEDSHLPYAGGPPRIVAIRRT